MRLRVCLVALVSWTVACGSEESTISAVSPTVECVGIVPLRTAGVCDAAAVAPFADLECHRFEFDGGKREVGVWVPRGASQLNANAVDAPHPTCTTCPAPVAGLGRIMFDDAHPVDLVWEAPTGGSYGQFLFTPVGTQGLGLAWGDILVAPGNGAVYTVVRHGGHGLETRSKHVLDGNRLITPGSEFNWVGVTGAASAGVLVYSDHDLAEPLATVAQGHAVTVLACENERQRRDSSIGYLTDWTEPRCLVKTEFGLVGWAPLDWGRATSDGTLTVKPIVEGMFYAE